MLLSYKFLNNSYPWNFLNQTSSAFQNRSLPIYQEISTSSLHTIKTSLCDDQIFLKFFKKQLCFVLRALLKDLLTNFSPPFCCKRLYKSNTQEKTTWLRQSNIFSSVRWTVLNTSCLRPFYPCSHFTKRTVGKIYTNTKLEVWGKQILQ